MSNRLIDIFNDAAGEPNFIKNLHYKHHITSKLEKLRKAVYKQHKTNEDRGFHENLMTSNDDKEDLKFIWNLIDDLKDNPQRTASRSELKKCNELWVKYS